MNFDRNRPFGLNGAKVRMQVRTPIRSKSKSKSTPKCCKIGPMSVKIAHQGVPGAFGGPSVAQERQKAAQEGPQATPRASLGAHKGVPRGIKTVQRVAKGSPRPRQRVLGKGKINHKSTSEAKKVKFAKSAPRLGPADVLGTSPPPRSTPNRPKIAPSRSLEPQHGPAGRP